MICFFHAIAKRLQNIQRTTSLEFTALNFRTVAEMYPFRPVKSEPGTVNYQNTAIIHREESEWLLGYVQGVREGELFINFDCIASPPSWIRSQDVWHHNFVSPELAGTVKQKGHAAVYVALRDEEDGPYRFRPGKLLSAMLGDGLYYVQLDSAGAENCTLAVHRLQVTSMLPSRKPLSFRTTSGFTYFQYVVPFDNARSLSTTEVAGEHGLRSHHSSPAIRVKKEPWEDRFREWMQMINHIGCRFHMVIEIDKIVFIGAEIYSHELNEMLHRYWSPVFLKELFEKHHSGAYKLHPACILPSSATLSTTCFMDQDLELAIGSLSKPLHMDILYSFDLHIQANMKRVCAAWYLLLTDSAAQKDIVIDIQKLERNNTALSEASSTNYMLGFLTDRTVAPKTRSLTLAKGTLGFRHRVCVLTELLQLKRIKLSTIILRDWLSDMSPIRFDETAYLGLRCGYLFNYFNVCERLIILTTSFAVENFFFSVTFGRPPDIPEHEAKFLNKRVQLNEPEASVLIPRLIFQSNQSNEQIVRSLLCAVENNFPPVRNTMYDEDKTIVDRWVRGLKYPEEWRVIRDLLNLFNGFHADGSRQDWNDIDLRNLDVFRLNKLTVTLINGYFSEKPRTLQNWAQ